MNLKKSRLHEDGHTDANVRKLRIEHLHCRLFIVRAEETAGFYDVAAGTTILKT